MTRDEMYQLYLEALEEMKAEASKHDFSPEGDDRLSSAMQKFELHRLTLISFDALEMVGNPMEIAHVFEALRDIRPYVPDRRHKRPIRPGQKKQIGEGD